ncbi:MAG: hypothetical protein KC592_05350 [Nitrospira sp.]|nr:hypothetical protein [Nitrospira sp.]
MPTLQATWAPVYLEPIMHSGERIAIGVAGVSSTGERLVVPTISESQLTCIFGPEGSDLFNIVQIGLEDLKEFLDDSVELENWDSPLSGVQIGDTRKSLGDDLTSILNLGIRRTASFAGYINGQRGSQSLELVKTYQSEEDNWPKSIQDCVLRERLDFKGYFSQSVPLVQNARMTKFDFFGRKYVANFGKLIPKSKSLSRLQNTAKAKLWDLVQLREDQFISNVSSFELILWRPREDDQAYSAKEMDDLNEAILELDGEAKKQKLATIPVYNAAEASRIIITKEAA